MTTDKTEVLNKLKKLFAIADPKRGGSDGEIDNALRFIDKIMKENNLSMSEVNLEDAEISAVTTEASTVRYYQRWHRFLSAAIAILCECKAMTSKKRGERGLKFSFIGLKQDTDLASELFQSLVMQIKTSSNILFSNHIDRRSYCDGFVMEILNRAKALHEARKNASSERGLIFVGRKSIAIKKEMEKNGVRFTTTRLLRNQTQAFVKGTADGRNADLSMRKKQYQLQ